MTVCSGLSQHAAGMIAGFLTQ